MLGEGQAEFDGEIMPALDALRRASLQPLELEAKEGLSLVNGTQAMAAVGTMALLSAENMCKVADIAGAMTLEGLKGIPAAFDQRVQDVRPHPGQSTSAQNLRRLLGALAVPADSANRVKTLFVAMHASVLAPPRCITVYARGLRAGNQQRHRQPTGLSG